MKIIENRWARTALAVVCALGLQTGALAAPIDITYIGTWTTVSNNTGAGDPGLEMGQRYVVKITYDDTSAATNDVDVLQEGSFAPSGQFMTTVDLAAAGNSLDILVPMEGLDAGSPFVYAQDESTHFPAFIPKPTLNFTNNSAISDKTNIIGLEFEGDFATGAGGNYIEMYNTAANTVSPINMVSQVINDPSLEIRGINSLAEAVDLIVDAGADIVYSAGDTTKSTNSSVVQSNDLGAGRSDGEDFVNATWKEGGVNLVGTPTGNDIAVAIQNSGLTNTIDTTTWVGEFTEQLTDLSASDDTMVSYANANPSITASATAQATGYSFASMIEDADLAIAALIANFEVLTSTAVVGAIDATAFFSDLLSTGNQSNTFAELLAAFGVGTHTAVFNVSDLANAVATASVSFTVPDPGTPVPVPATLLLLLVGLLGMSATRGRAR